MKKVMFLFLLLLPWGGGWLYSRVYTVYQPECFIRFSFAYVDEKGGFRYSDGTFTMMSTLWGNGSGAYMGTLYRNAEKWPAHLSFTYDFKFNQGIATVHMRTVSPELGNRAPLEYIAKYVSPVLKPGETNRTRFILLDGEKIAAGTTKFPRMVCTD